MTPAPTPVKSLKTTYNGHLVKRRNTEIFSLDLLIPTTCHSKKLKFRPPIEKPRPALRGGVAGRGTHKRPPAFILLLFSSLGNGPQVGASWSVGTFSTGGRGGVHSGPQIVTKGFPLFTATQFLRIPILPSPPPVCTVRPVDEHPAPHETGGWCRADCHCA